LIKEIAHIKFIKLSELWLWDNRIESVEGLTRMDMPFIREINISASPLKQTKMTSSQLGCSRKQGGLYSGNLHSVMKQLFSQ
jgi:hypothetical protein